MRHAPLRTAPLLALIVLATACPPTPVQRCTASEDCPAGYACDPATRFCVAQASDAGIADGHPLDAAVADQLGGDLAPSDTASADLTGAETRPPDSAPVDARPGDPGSLDTAGPERAPLDAQTTDQASADIVAFDHTTADSAAVDAGAAEAGAPAVCGTTRAVVESFDAASLSWLWWLADGYPVQASVSGGQLHIALSAANASGWGNVGTDHIVSLRGSAMDVEARVELPNREGHEAYLEYHVDSANFAAIAVANGAIAAVVESNNAPEVQDRGYDPEAHRFWRLSESAGTLRAEVSPDRTNWQLLGAFDTPAWIDRGIVMMGAGSWATPTLAGSAWFDNLNVGSSEPFCKGSSFVDRFDRTVLGIDWEEPREASCSVSFTGGGSLALTRAAASNSGSCSVASSHLYDVAGDTVEVTVPVVPGAISRGSAGIAFYHPSLWGEVSLDAAGAWGYVSHDGVTDASSSGTLRGRRLRLGHQGDQLQVAVLDDSGVEWSATLDLGPAAPTLVSIVLFVDVESGGTGAATAHFDDLN